MPGAPATWLRNWTSSVEEAIHPPCGVHAGDVELVGVFVVLAVVDDLVLGAVALFVAAIFMVEMPQGPRMLVST